MQVNQCKPRTTDLRLPVLRQTGPGRSVVRGKQVLRRIVEGLLMRHPSLIPLSHDHHHGLALALRCRKQALGQIKPVGVHGLEEMAKEVRDFFSKNLERHFQAEEEILFPIIRFCASESQQMVEELIREHQQIRQGVDRLEEKTSLSKTLFDLGDLLERHIRREERELFPLFEKYAALAETEKIKEEVEKILAGRNPKSFD